MNILVVCQHYWPENFRVTEICEALVERGHSVTALVGLPNYPDGKVPAEYKRLRNRRQEHGGVHIRRCMEIGRRPGKLGLAVNYVSYMLSACWKALWLKRDYDAIYAFSTSPVLMSLPAAMLRRLTGKKLLIYVLDIWPACLAAMNVPEGSALYRFMRRVSRWVYASADRLAYSSVSFRRYMLQTHGLDMGTDGYLPQFADDVFAGALPARAPSAFVELVFAGNVGKVQSVETLVEAMSFLRGRPVRLHVVGDGANLGACRALADELELGAAVTFYGRRPLEDMPAFYAMADAMLVSMKNDPLVSFTLPGKVQSYMAAGKPVLGSIAGEARMVVERAACGFCAEPEDARAFARAVERFLAADGHEAMGESGRRYYREHFTKRGHMDKLEAMLQALCGGQSR